jgi:hypothetical protein
MNDCCVGSGDKVFVGISGGGNPTENDLVGPSCEFCCPCGKKFGMNPVGWGCNGIPEGC